MTIPVAPNRECCPRCLRPISECYCHKIKRFATHARFVILIHPNERRRGIATGRMTSLCLLNSELIEGADFSQDSRINHLINDPLYDCKVLYPDDDATYIDRLDDNEREGLFTKGRIPLIFIIDGTWHTAKSMLRLSKNLQSLPFICFCPERPSRFRVRLQPHENCYSTIEAVHRMLEIFGGGVPTSNRPYDNLLEVFDFMVERQLSHVIRNTKIVLK